MSGRTLAADDYGEIRRRMEEMRGEKVQEPVEEQAAAADLYYNGRLIHSVVNANGKTVRYTHADGGGGPRSCCTHKCFLDFHKAEEINESRPCHLGARCELHG